MVLLPRGYFLEDRLSEGLGHHPYFFLPRGFQHGETCGGAKRLAEHGLCRKNTTEGSLEGDRKLNTGRDAFGIPQTKHHRDIIHTRRSARGKRIQKDPIQKWLTAHTPWKWKASRVGLYCEDGTSVLITSPAPVCLSESAF